MSTSKPLATRILWGLVIGVVAAVITLGIDEWHPATLTTMQAISTAVFDPLGQIFLRMLFFVVTDWARWLCAPLFCSARTWSSR